MSAQSLGCGILYSEIVTSSVAVLSGRYDGVEFCPQSVDAFFRSRAQFWQGSFGKASVRESAASFSSVGSGGCPLRTRMKGV